VPEPAHQPQDAAAAQQAQQAALARHMRRLARDLVWLAAELEAVPPRSPAATERMAAPGTMAMPPKPLGPGDLKDLSIDALVDWHATERYHRRKARQQDFVATVAVSPSTLVRKLKQLGVTWEQIKAAARLKLLRGFTPPDGS
jgi:hypothetical protein